MIIWKKKEIYLKQAIIKFHLIFFLMLLHLWLLLHFFSLFLHGCSSPRLSLLFIVLCFSIFCSSSLWSLFISFMFIVLLQHFIVIDLLFCVFLSLAFFFSFHCRRSSPSLLSFFTAGHSFYIILRHSSLSSFFISIVVVLLQRRYPSLSPCIRGHMTSGMNHHYKYQYHAQFWYQMTHWLSSIKLLLQDLFFQTLGDQGGWTGALIKRAYYIFRRQWCEIRPSRQQK